MEFSSVQGKLMKANNLTANLRDTPFSTFTYRYGMTAAHCFCPRANLTTQLTDPIVIDCQAGIDTLGIIAHDHDILMQGAKAIHQVTLDSIGILVLVN